MFYIKVKNDDAELKVFITDENVFATCPECGKEKQIDLAELLKDGKCDLYTTNIYCTDCAKLMEA